MASRSTSRRKCIRSAALVVLGAFACDLGVEPPPDTPLLAISARDASLFVTRGSGEPDAVTIQISNNGSGTLSGLRLEGPIYTGAASDWLDRTLQDSTITLTGRAVTMKGDTLETGSYEALVDVVADAAGNSPRTITVNLLVGKSQQIALSVGSVTFAAQATNPPPPRQTVAISNAGDGVLSELAIDSIVYRAGEPDGWLDTTLVRTRAPTVIELQPSSVPASEATLHATVFVGSRIADPPTNSIEVEYIIAPPPTLVLSATTLTLEAVEGETTPLVREITLRELNRRPLPGLTEPISSNPDWLTASRDPVDAPAILTITADPTGLAGGLVYRDTVFISSSAGDVEEVAVSLRVRRGPTVHVSMDTVRFTMNPTDPLPGPQLVRIENSGGGTLSGLTVNYPRPAEWLSGTITGTTSPADLVLAVLSAGVAAGSVDTAVVEIAGGGGDPERVTVLLEMLSGPSIVLSSDSLTFRSDSASQNLLLPPPLEVAVVNGGTGVLSGLTATVSGGSAWLGTPVLANTTATTTLVLQPFTVPDSGTYVNTVVIASGTPGVDAARLPVVFDVGADTASVATIGLSSDHVLFRYVETEAAPQVVLGVENLSSSDAFSNLSVRAKPAWLTAAFVDDNNDPPAALRLTLDPRDLDGLDTPLDDVVRISARGMGGATPVELPVTLDLSGPEMVATSNQVVFRAFRGQAPPPDSQLVTVSNKAAGTLRDIFATGAPQWLVVTPASPSSAQNAPASVVMRPNTTDLASTAASRLQVNGAAENSPLPIDLRYEIDSGPTVTMASTAVRMSAVEASADPDSLTVDLYNSGKGDLGSLSAAASQPWLSATIDASVLPNQLVLVAMADTLASGTYTDNVIVTSTLGGDVAVAVKFAVAPQPRIEVSPGTLVFHASALTDSLPPAQTVTVFDPAGGPSGQIAATSDLTWLDVDVDSTTLPVTVFVRPNEVLDSRGSPHEATVAIESTVGTGAAQQVQITYNIDVGRDPVIDLSSERLEFRKPTSSRDEIPAQTVQIDNGGSRTLRELSVADVTEGGPVDWLFLLLDSRIAPATLTVAIKPAEAAITQQNEATLEITGEDAEPRRLTVMLTEGG